MFLYEKMWLYITEGLRQYLFLNGHTLVAIAKSLLKTWYYTR